MKTFKTHLQEAQNSKKVFIQHLEKMPPVKFLELAKKLDKEFGGILAKDKINITEKIDGSALRIGYDEKGRFFVQSATSPSFYNKGDFRNRLLEKGYDPWSGEQFDNILEMMKTDRKLQSTLSKFKADGMLIEGEILYPPLGTVELDKIKFIRISYDRKKLGSEYTFVPINVYDKNRHKHPQSDEIFKALLSISNAKRKYLRPNISISRDIDITTDLKDLENNFIKKYKNLDTLLVSRKKIDKELKLRLKSEISELQHRMAQRIMTYVQGGSLGADFEGIVIKLSDGTLIKIVTDTFKTTRSQFSK